MESALHMSMHRHPPVASGFNMRPHPIRFHKRYCKSRAVRRNLSILLTLLLYDLALSMNSEMFRSVKINVREI